MTSPTNILVVDDDSDFCEYLRIILEAHGYAVRVAPDARQGTAAMAGQRPDLIILDAMMSYDFQGLGLIQAIRQDPANDTMPIILVSAVLREPQHALLENIPTGAIDAFLTKPIEPARVLEQVETLLNTRARAGS